MNDSYLIGNWKLFKTKKDIEVFFDAVEASHYRETLKPRVGMAVAVSPTHLEYAVCKAPPGLEIFSQNSAYALDGALTGEISPLQLRDLGVVGTLVGHSERRQFFADTSETVVQRALLALEQGLKVVFCVGETLEEREAGRTETLLREQIGALLKKADLSKFESAVEHGLFWVAYEPVWAIGTGRTASPEMAEEAHAQIRQIFEADGFTSPKILYGGSVKPANFKELLAQPNISGGLVGGASLEAASYLTLLGHL